MADRTLDIRIENTKRRNREMKATEEAQYLQQYPNAVILQEPLNLGQVLNEENEAFYDDMDAMQHVLLSNISDISSNQTIANELFKSIASNEDYVRYAVSNWKEITKKLGEMSKPSSKALFNIIKTNVPRRHVTIPQETRLNANGKRSKPDDNDDVGAFNVTYGSDPYAESSHYDGVAESKDDLPVGEPVPTAESAKNLCSSCWQEGIKTTGNASTHFIYTKDEYGKKTPIGENHLNEKWRQENGNQPLQYCMVSKTELSKKQIPKSTRDKFNKLREELNDYISSGHTAIPIDDDDDNDTEEEPEPAEAKPKSTKNLKKRRSPVKTRTRGSSHLPIKIPSSLITKMQSKSTPMKSKSTPLATPDEGTGLKRDPRGRKKAVRIGKGITEQPRYFEINGKLVNLDELRRNKLKVQFAKTYAQVSNLGGIPMLSDELRDCIMSVCEDKYNKRLYKLLSVSDKKIFARFVRNLKIPNVDIDSEDLNVDWNKYNILLGEFQAGNDNKDLIKELKKYIRIAMEDKRISKADGLQLLLEIAEHTSR